MLKYPYNANVSYFQVEINHASEIDEIFDAISYRKGASLIRMLQSYIGADTFQVFSCYVNFHYNFTISCRLLTSRFCSLVETESSFQLYLKCSSH